MISHNLFYLLAIQHWDSKIYVSNGLNIPLELECLIREISQNGEIPYEWRLVRKLIHLRLCKVSDMSSMLCWIMLISRFISQTMDCFFKERGFSGPVTETYAMRREEILRLFSDFEYKPPFTIQRLCEVLIENDRLFKSTYALLNSFTRLLSITPAVS